MICSVNMLQSSNYRTGWLHSHEASESMTTIYRIALEKLLIASEDKT